jgi:hypothetical protein
LEAISLFFPLLKTDFQYQKIFRENLYFESRSMLTVEVRKEKVAGCSAKFSFGVHPVLHRLTGGES